MILVVIFYFVDICGVGEKGYIYLIIIINIIFITIMGSCCTRMYKESSRSKRITQEIFIENDASELAQDRVLNNKKDEEKKIVDEHPMAGYVFPRKQTGLSVNKLI